MKEYILNRATQKNVFSETELALLDHGIDVFVNDSVNTLCVLIQSFLFHDPVQGIVYLLAFAGLRSYAGGWHARTKTGCFLSYQLMYMVSQILLRFRMSGLYRVVIAVICTVYMCVSGPVEHLYNPLSTKVRKRNHRKLIRNSIILLVILIGLVLLQNDVAQTIAIVMTYNRILMEVLRHSKYGRQYEN
ncbi:MAG: accessory gene regulator B family protein [Solobacterium sp.]|nr:accessory gene regulator B family protein [Solobacterium sp.]